ncbi:MAG TPA: hypothetical protein VMW80_05850 [Candidatus Dormibacteraeota bacterium]|nr:hypothetical protein [Candidatus Dormibacteraeota bacterium]
MGTHSARAVSTRTFAAGRIRATAADPYGVSRESQRVEVEQVIGCAGRSAQGVGFGHQTPGSSAHEVHLAFTRSEARGQHL